MRKPKQTNIEKKLKKSKPELDAISEAIATPANSNLSTAPASATGGESSRSEQEELLDKKISEARRKKYEIGHMITPDDAASLSSGELEAKREEKHRLLQQQKSVIKDAYEEKMLMALSDVAELQTMIIKMGIDPMFRVDGEYLERLKLAMKGAEQVLNRAIGRPTTRIEGDVKHSVADEMAKMHDDWVIDVESTDDE